jgi:RecA-family ATPase
MSISQNGLPSKYPDASWDGWSGKIIGELNLKRTSKNEYHGPCPNCGGTDRFWICPSPTGDVAVNCRQCKDFAAIKDSMRSLGLMPNAPEKLPIIDHTPSLANDFQIIDETLHPYLQSKGVPAFDTQKVGDFLTVKIYNNKGKVVGQQMISPTGAKKFSKGMPVEGNFGVVGGQLGDVAYVTEGWADAATIAHVTGMATVFGLNDKNMTKAIASLKAVKPNVTFIVAADNDEPGRAAAEQCAADHGVEHAMPPTPFKDYSDLFLARGGAALVQALRPVKVEPERAPESAAEAATEPKRDWPTAYDMFDEAALKPRQWIYGQHYLRGFVSVLASAGGVGKTSMQIVEALAIVTGKPLLGEPVIEQCNVWIINLEDPIEELQRRVLAAMKHYNIKPDEVRGKLFLDAGRDLQMMFAVQTREGVTPNNALVDHMIDKIKEHKIGVTFIDPIVSAHGVNENDNMAMGAVVSLIREVADKTNSAIGLVHHIRKGNGEDAGIDSVRGAGSLIGAARAARVINRVPPEEAMKLGVAEGDSTGLFRVDNGKANLTAPSAVAVYRQMIGVQIANGEWVGVATDFKMPDVFDGVTARHAMSVQRMVGSAADQDEPYRADSRAKNWVGKAVAEVLDLDLDKASEKARASAIAKKWLETDVLRKDVWPDSRAGRDVQVVVVGAWITGSEAGM